MDWTWYLFSFKGRINRARFSLSGLVMMGWMLLIGWLGFFWLHLVAGGHIPPGGMKFHFSLDTIFDLFDPASWHSLSPGDIMPIAIQAAGVPVLIWIYLATSIKRLHDRDKSGWWLVPFVLLPSLYQHFEDRLPDSYLILPLALAAAAFPIWAFVELACLKGTAGTNRFGPNPLGKRQMRPRSTEARLRATTAWDQQSEIEMVPHTGSPPPGMHVNRGA
jgi:uncharacterized membrane protein YhaH (DUF805 family)